MSKPFLAAFQAISCSFLFATYVYSGGIVYLGVAIAAVLFTTWFMIDTAGEDF